MAYPACNIRRKAGATTAVSLECTIRELLSWKQEGGAMRAISCMTCAIVLCVASSLSGAVHRRTLLTSQR